MCGRVGEVGAEKPTFVEEDGSDMFDNAAVDALLNKVKGQVGKGRVG